MELGSVRWSRSDASQERVPLMGRSSLKVNGVNALLQSLQHLSSLTGISMAKVIGLYKMHTGDLSQHG